MLISVLTALWTGLISSHVCGKNLPILPAILWDPRNPFFGCEDNTITVAIGDKLNIVCPNKGVNYEGLESDPKTDELYETAYLLDPKSEDKFNKCDSRGSRTLLSCNGNNKELEYNQLSFKERSGSSSAILFHAGKTYYVIGTAFRKRENINNTVGGSCEKTDNVGAYRLRMKIKVCSHDEVNIHKNCTRCTTASCYYKSCTRCGPWVMKGTSVSPDQSNTCYNYFERNCSNNKTDVTFVQTNTINIPCPTTPKPSTAKPTTAPATTEATTKASPNLGKRTDDSKDSLTYILVGGIFVMFLIGFGTGCACKTYRYKRSRARHLNSNGKDAEGTQGVHNPAFSSDTLSKKENIKELLVASEVDGKVPIANGEVRYNREIVDLKLLENGKNLNTLRNVDQKL